MRVVCDTNILVRAIASPGGAAAALLEQLMHPEHKLLLSHALLAELYDVLRRTGVRRMHRLSDTRVRRLIARLYTQCEMVRIVDPLPRIVPDDPDDDQIVLAAIVGRADFLCTLDSHFSAQKVVDICHVFGVRVISDTELLMLTRDKNS